MADIKAREVKDTLAKVRDAARELDAALDKVIDDIGVGGPQTVNHVAADGALREMRVKCENAIRVVRHHAWKPL